MDISLRELFDSAAKVFEPTYLHSSALSAVREYNAKSVEDREAWALICALYDFQKDVVKILLPMLRGFIAEVERRKLSIVDLAENLGEASTIAKEFTWAIGEKRPKIQRGWKHIGKHQALTCILDSVAQIMKEHGSINKLVKKL
ncbi:MAG: hypothetical protein DRJ33_04625, partial [Candidatus Methanomethylicota archaeon]